MLCRLAIINFINAIQILATEGFIPSRDIMANVIQQAQQIQKDARKIIKKHPIGDVFEDQSSKKRCPSQPLNGQTNANKGCNKYIDPHLQEAIKTSQILVFVSFSMPESSLKSLFLEASKHNAVLVMQGLVDDSFVKTAQKLQALDVTVDINPELFEKYHINSVPTFIYIKDGRPARCLKGNVTLEFAAQKLKEHIDENQPIKNHSSENPYVEVVP